ncbi:MAG: type I 3-dehydroquinate dehydratase [Candidatus Gracilibacteria bacterium]|nr:type I 3-dehydroquinate dehydratase [Candidatus Gracilibacteria bacterium]
MKNIIIYGMRGTGKSTIGKLLAKKLNKNFVDLDFYITNKINATIDQFVKENGWDKFRDNEYKSLKEVLENYNDSIISLGGGTIIFERNQKLLLKNSYKLIYVYSDLDVITKRVVDDQINLENRPSLTGSNLYDDLKTVYEERKDIYEKFYDLKVTNNGILEDCLDEILSKVNYGSVCVPIIDFDKIEEKIGVINNSNKVKFVELRIDYLDDFEKFDEIISKINKKIILTNRKKIEGGRYTGNSKDSFLLLSKYIDKVDYVDFELSNGEYVKDLKNRLGNKTKLIISYHNFLETPNFYDLKKVIESMSMYNPDVYKIAVMPNCEKDVEIMYKLCKYFKDNYDKDFVFISMGKLGEKTRWEFPKIGKIFSFGSLGEESAPGQISFEKLYDLIYND